MKCGQFYFYSVLGYIPEIWESNYFQTLSNWEFEKMSTESVIAKLKGITRGDIDL
jgi:hypothetical protein